MAVAVMFSACNKDQDGVYTPGKKIQKIYIIYYKEILLSNMN